MGKQSKAQNKVKQKTSKKGDRAEASWLIFVAMAIFLVFMWTPFRWVYTAMIAAVSAASCYEILHAVKAKNKLLYAVTMAVSAFLPFKFSYNLSFSILIAVVCYVMLLLVIMVSMNKKTKFVDVLAGLYASTWLAFCYSCFVLIRDIYITYPTVYTKWEGFFFVMMVFGCSWGPDGLAYLVGRKFGKHKLAPVISPKKSVEGAVGGVVLTGVGVNLVLFVYSLIIKKACNSVIFESMGNMQYIYGMLFVMGMAVVSIFGDLAASVIKRNFGIKDYSHILGSHGGFMDRFDSSLFVLPAIYCLLTVINL